MELEQIVPTIFLLVVLILIIPNFIRLNSNSKLFIKNLLIWSIIVVSIIIISYLVLK